MAEAALCMYPHKGAVAFAGETRAGKCGRIRRICSASRGSILFPQGPLTPNYFNHAGGVEALSKYRHFYAGYYVGNPQYALDSATTCLAILPHPSGRHELCRRRRGRWQGIEIPVYACSRGARARW